MSTTIPSDADLLALVLTRPNVLLALYRRIRVEIAGPWTPVSVASGGVLFTRARKNREGVDVCMVGDDDGKWIAAKVGEPSSVCKSEHGAMKSCDRSLSSVGYLLADQDLA